MERPAVASSTFGDILEAVPLDDPRWSRIDGLKTKVIRSQGEDKSFAMQVFTAESDRICTLTEGMTQKRGTGTKIQHPTDPDLLRIPTPLEHTRAK